MCEPSKELPTIPQYEREGWIRRILCQTLLGLEALNFGGVVHRDFSRNNLMLNWDLQWSLKDYTPYACIIDFGASRTFEAEGVDMTNELCTPSYRAPEQQVGVLDGIKGLAGKMSYKETVDVWAAGCMVVEMVTGGSVPFGPVSKANRAPETPKGYLERLLQLVGVPTDEELKKENWYPSEKEAIAECSLASFDAMETVCPLPEPHGSQSLRQRLEAVVDRLKESGCAIDNPEQVFDKEVLSGVPVTPELRSLLRRMLSINYLKRPTASMLLDDVYFAEDPVCVALIGHARAPGRRPSLPCPSDMEDLYCQTHPQKGIDALKKYLASLCRNPSA